jgi:hypothetical protein
MLVINHFAVLLSHGVEGQRHVTARVQRLGGLRIGTITNTWIRIGSDKSRNFCTFAQE